MYRYIAYIPIYCISRNVPSYFEQCMIFLHGKRDIYGLLVQYIPVPTLFMYDEVEDYAVVKSRKIIHLNIWKKKPCGGALFIKVLADFGYI